MLTNAFHVMNVPFPLKPGDDIDIGNFSERFDCSVLYHGTLECTVYACYCQNLDGEANERTNNNNNKIDVILDACIAYFVQIAVRL